MRGGPQRIRPRPSGNEPQIIIQQRVTQEDTARALEGLLGQRLPQASISAIERAYEGDRHREFDAHEILAFALGFDLPLT